MQTDIYHDRNQRYDWLCRVGIHGQIGRFRPHGQSGRLQRSDRVVCRTSRGLEIAELLTFTNRSAEARGHDGRILRRMTLEDRMLWDQLQILSRDSLLECQSWLRQNRRDEVLIEVEPMMDGKTLYFHFAGSVASDLQAILDRLVTIYQSQVEVNAFAQLVENGCGPGCGTEEKSGCGTGGGCSVCVVASACRTNARS